MPICGAANEREYRRDDQNGCFHDLIDRTPSSATPIRPTTQMADGNGKGRSYVKLTPSF